MPDKRINVSSPEINVGESMENLQRVLESGQLAQGPYVQEAEKILADLLGAEYAALINNGTSSLKAAIAAGVCAVRQIEPAYIDRYLNSREVIVPAFSFNATLNAALQLGLTARTVDINKDTFCIDPKKAAEAVNNNTVAVVPVDLYGQPADTPEIERSLTYKAVALVRDSAQAHGATIDGQSLAEHAAALSLSFYATKNVNSGEGGAVVSNLETVDEVVRMYRNQGMSQRYHYDLIGDNLRMSELHAAVLITQLGKMTTNAAIRQENAAKLTEQLSHVEGITPPLIAKGMGHVFHQYTVLVEPEFGMNRDELGQALLENNIGTGIYYPKIMTDHRTYAQHPRIKAGETPVAKEVATKVLSLPVHTSLTESDVERISQTISLLQAHKGKLN